MDVAQEHSRENDLEVNPVREKKVTNVRNPNSEDRVTLSPPRFRVQCPGLAVFTTLHPYMLSCHRSGTAHVYVLSNCGRACRSGGGAQC